MEGQIIFKRLWLWVSKRLKSLLTWGILILVAHWLFYYFEPESTIFDYLPPPFVDFLKSFPPTLVAVLIALFGSWAGARGIKEQTEKLIAAILETEGRLIKELTAMLMQQSEFASYTNRGRQLETE